MMQPDSGHVLLGTKRSPAAARRSLPPWLLNKGRAHRRGMPKGAWHWQTFARFLLGAGPSL